MTAIAILACLAVLVAVGYFFVCCTVTAALWLRDRLENRRSVQQDFA